MSNLYKKGDTKKIEAIDLFCGVGGLTHGLKQANITVLAGLDNDATCANAYEKNNDTKFIEADITKYDFLKLKTLYSKNSIKVLVGCAPCQPFSSHTFKVKGKETDKRWNLIDYFLNAINIIHPDVISMENVRGITKTKIFDNFINELKKIGYFTDHKIIFCPDYGIPQNRSRLVLLASRLGKIEIPVKTHNKNDYVVVGDVIKKMSKLIPGQISRKDKIHKAKNLSEINIIRIKQSKPQGTWKDWDRKILPECYKKASGKTYTAVYGRMSWDDIAPTITTQFHNYGSGRFGHPSQDRAISFREGALLQTFPKAYFFSENLPLDKLGQHIGNAVPPRLGYVIGKAITKHIRGNYENE